MMQHFLPKCSSSAASNRPKPVPTQQPAKPMSATPAPRPPKDRQDRQQDATPSRSTKDPSPRSPWIRCLRSPPDHPGRKRRGPSLVTARPPCKQPLMCLLSPRSALGAEGNVLLIPYGPALVPGCPTTVILDKIKHTFSKREQISSSAYQSLEPIQPLVTRAEAWQAISGVSELVMSTIRRGYSLQFARRPPHFSGVIASTVCSKDTPVLHTEEMNLLVKGAIEIIPPAQSESGF